MALSRSVDVQDFINERPFGGYQALVLILCFLVLAADGFDTAAIGFIAPALREQWNLGPGQLSVLFVSGLAGLMIGAFVFGPIADRIGRKAILVLTTLGFGVASIVSAAATNVEMLAVLRFVTGLGLGGAMPIAVTLTSEFCPERKRSFLVMIMFCGFTLGGASGGLAAAGLVATHGWEGVLVLGGIIPIVLAVALFFLLPESVRYLVLKGGQDAKIASILRRIDPKASLVDTHFVGVHRVVGSPVGHLFRRDLLAGTVLLWITFFMSLLIYYLLTSWLPTLLNTAGQTQQSSALIALMLPIGSTVGAFVIGYFMDRIGAHAALATSYSLAAFFIVLLGLSTATPWLLVVSVFGAGFGTGGSQIGINALSATFYPTGNRATGVSWANAVGRAGSLFGSMVGGYLLNIGWALSTVFVVAAVPALIAAAAIFAMGRMGRPGVAEVEARPA